MVAFPYRRQVSLPVAPLAAAVIGVLTATVFALMPTGILEAIVLDSGIVATIPAAEPPLDLTARAVLICAGGGGLALIAWLGLILLVGTRSIVTQRAGYLRGDQGAPVLRRDDAHPDAPPRRPVFANRALRQPFLEICARRPHHGAAEVPAESLSALIRSAHSVPAPPIGAAFDDEREIPANLDVPLAAYDPDAIRQCTSESGFACAPEAAPESGHKSWPVPSPSALPASRSAPLAIAAESPIPVPVSAPAPEFRPVRRAPIERPDPAATIHALLDRLERSVARVESPPPPPPPALSPREESLQEALVTLRRLASRG